MGRCRSALRYIVRCTEVDPHGLHDFAIRNGDDVIYIVVNDIDGLGFGIRQDNPSAIVFTVGVETGLPA